MRSKKEILDQYNHDSSEFRTLGKILEVLLDIRDKDYAKGHEKGTGGKNGD